MGTGRDADSASGTPPPGEEKGAQNPLSDQIPWATLANLALEPVQFVADKQVAKKPRDALREGQASFWTWLIIIQLALMHVIVFLVGFGCMTFPEWFFHMFVSGTMLETYFIHRVIIRHLFPADRID